MARGQRKSIEEKITAKQELIDALFVRIQSEKKELDVLFEEKRKKELEAVNSLMEENGLEAEEVAQVLKAYLDNRSTKVS